MTNWVSGDAPEDESARGTSYPNLPNDQRPVARSNKTQSDLMDSLVADRDNAKYTQAISNREGAPTRPLNPSAAPSSPVSAAPAAPVKTAAVPQAPQVQTSDIAAPPPAVAPAPSPRPSAPAPLVQQAAAPSPAPAPAPRATGPETLEQEFARRLAEQSGPVSSPQAIPVAAAAPAPMPVAQSLRPISDSGVVHLIPPNHSAQRASRGGAGVRSLADYTDGQGGASFRVAAVAFGEGTAELGSVERNRLRDLAAMLKKSSSVRVIGTSSSARLDVDPTANRDGNRELAAERADNVARELVRLGVPARKIFAGGATESGRQSLASAGEDMTEIYIDY